MSRGQQRHQAHSEEGLWVLEHGEYEGYDHALLLESRSAAFWASSKPVEWPVRLRDPAIMGMSVTPDIPEES